MGRVYPMKHRRGEEMSGSCDPGEALLTLPGLKHLGFSVQRSQLTPGESDMISLSVERPKSPRSGVPRPTICPNGLTTCRAGLRGVLGSRTPTLSVPSKFSAGKEFLPATGNSELSKSDPRRDMLIIVKSLGLASRTDTHSSHPWKGWAFCDFSVRITGSSPVGRGGSTG